jgi:hypothetical protein
LKSVNPKTKGWVRSQLSIDFSRSDEPLLTLTDRALACPEKVRTCHRDHRDYLWLQPSVIAPPIEAVCFVFNSRATGLMQVNAYKRKKQ